jgi:hypothetical protein
VGVSQSGRYLRDHIAQGFNQDESGKRVFDGVLAHISGVGRVFLNAEFGQPGRTNTQHEDHLMPENEFPFSTALMKDPVSGKRAPSCAARQPTRTSSRSTPPPSTGRRAPRSSTPIRLAGRTWPCPADLACTWWRALSTAGGRE